MRQKTALVTGANSGIGKAVSIALARQGMHVVLLCRSKERGEVALSDVEAQSGQRATLMRCDLASLEDIERFCEAFRSRFHALDVLVNNAGVISPRRRETQDGLELDFGVNHVAHFLLTLSLLDLMKASGDSRIIVVGSAVHRYGKLDFNDLGMEKRYTPAQAYCRSKLCNILFTRALAKRLKETSVTINCVHPGAVATNIVIKTDFGIGRVLMKVFSPIVKSAKQGAEAIVHLAASEECAGINGAYFSKCNRNKIKGPARDMTLACTLWDISLDLVSDYIEPDLDWLAKTEEGDLGQYSEIE